MEGHWNRSDFGRSPSVREEGTYPTCLSPREVFEAVVPIPGVVVFVQFARHVECQSSNVIYRIVDRAVLGTSRPNQASQVLL